MSKYSEISERAQKERASLVEGASELMAAFQQLYETAYEEGALSIKTKALIGIAISIGIRCDGCAYHHVEKAIDNGATREEVIETIGMAILIGGGPSRHYGSFVLSIYDEFIESKKK